MLAAKENKMLKNIVESVKSQISDHVLNQDAITELALAAFFAGGHILLSGPTGLGKTQWAQAFAGALGLSFGCERFFKNSIPQDFFGTYSFDHESNQFNSRPGTFSSQVFQADEIDNTHPWIHSFIMDAIDRQKNSLTYADQSYTLPEPHFVIATLDETVNLPKVLVDRFTMKLYVNYPGIAAEKQILQMHHVGTTPETESMPVCTPESIAQAKQEVQAITVEDAVFNYIVSIAETTRRIGVIQTGASTRASISLLQVAKAYAAINGRDYVTIDDVRSLAIPVLRHRITLRPDAVKQGVQADNIIESIIVGKRML